MHAPPIQPGNNRHLSATGVSETQGQSVLTNAAPLPNVSPIEQQGSNLLGQVAQPGAAERRGKAGSGTPPFFRPPENSQASRSTGRGTAVPSSTERFIDSMNTDSSEEFTDSFEEITDSGNTNQSRGERARTYLEGLGIEVDTSETGGLTALMVAAWEDEQDIVGHLLDAGASAHSVNDATGDNALILAASFGHVEVIRHLLNVRGLELNHANLNGDTALMLAASGNWPGVVELLLAHGADVNRVNRKHGYTALMLASAYGCIGAAEKLTRAPSIELDRSNPHGDTALILAIAGKHAKLVQCLLDAGAEATPARSQARSAFGMAMEGKATAIVELLLDRDQRIDGNFNASSAQCDAFSVTVNDLLMIRYDPAPIDIAEPLELFKTMSRQIAADGDTRRLLPWLREKGMLMACAQELVALLAPAHAWALKTDNGRKGSRDRQRLIYCISALGQMPATGATERVRNTYRQAGLSAERVDRLDSPARQQLGIVASAANTAAAQLGNELVNLLIDLCFEQTSPKYEVREALLQACLVQEGFIEPLAKAIASGWHSVLAGMRKESISAPAGHSFVEIIDNFHQRVIDEAQTMLATVLKERLKQQALISSFRVMLPSKQEEVVHEMFQTQSNWLSQFCDQSLEMN